MKIGETIKMFRIANDCSVKELAERSGVSLAYISLIERTNRNVSCDKLKKIAGIFGVSVSTLARISEMSEQQQWSYKKTLFEVLKLYLEK